VKIFDPEPCEMPLELMWKKVEEFRPDVVGLTSVTPTFTTARKLALEAKRRLSCLVIMGGPHVSALPRSTLESMPRALDAVILGEGELPMLAVAAEFDAHGKVDFNKVPGAAFIENWKYKENPRPEFIADLDALPYPARDLVDLSLYYPLRWPSWSKKSTTLISSRGCPSQCTFCANISMGRKFRARSPGNVVGEMEYLAREYGLRYFKFCDDCFTADPGRVAEICELIISKRLNVAWDAYSRVNTLLDGALIRKMKKAGCVYVFLGIETGSQRILDLMKKGTTLKMAEECCSLLRKHGMAYHASFIVGNEGDTKETVAAAIAFAKKLSPDYTMFGAMIPFPGTPIFDKYFKDYDRPDTDWSNWCLDVPGWPYESRQTELSMEDILLLTSRANLQYFLHPVRFARALVFVAKVY
jgi:anaerobic magnesium-protoporphyrin IX monomethyl ester cyclase